MIFYGRTPVSYFRSTAAMFQGVDLAAEPKFKVGEMVEMELSNKGRGLPRWDMNADAGGSGVWVAGQVLGFEDDPSTGGPVVKIAYPNPKSGTLATWNFPLLGHKNYIAGQWNLSGYLRRSKPTKTIVCECGAKHTSTPHMHLSYCGLYSDPYQKKEVKQSLG